MGISKKTIPDLFEDLPDSLISQPEDQLELSPKEVMESQVADFERNSSDVKEVTRQILTEDNNLRLYAVINALVTKAADGCVSATELLLKVLGSDNETSTIPEIKILFDKNTDGIKSKL